MYQNIPEGVYNYTVYDSKIVLMGGSKTHSTTTVVPNTAPTEY